MERSWNSLRQATRDGSRGDERYFEGFPVARVGGNQVSVLLANELVQTIVCPIFVNNKRENIHAISIPLSR
mgnify:CR=1 FL=1